MGQKELEQVYGELVDAIESLGHPRRFGALIAGSLGTEKTMARMLQYVRRARPSSAEEIADEMLAIRAEFERYREKKIAEDYNGKVNELLNKGLEE